ncbi:MAG: glutamate-cysteine ligase family protein [Vicinamibacterales bacterium]
MPGAEPLHLFEAVGLELEYMIVDATSLDVRPISDEVLKAVAGTYETEVALGPVSWSNELALHVIELKTTEPAPGLDGVASAFQLHVKAIEKLLAPAGARLLPTAMHPWMDPHAELKLWPHGYDAVYAAFHRIFDCRGHGWANLQSAHINLPFAGDYEFGRLHAAIRLVLPILAGLAASSPVADGRRTGLMDTRLDVYRHNADRVPSVAGHVIPEPVFTEAEYRRDILQRIYDDMAPLDPDGTLRDEWVNARGAIARFDRGAIEIRVIDVQECPRADLAVAAATVAAVHALVEGRWRGARPLQDWPTGTLAAMLDACVRDGDQAVVTEEAYAQAFGFPERGPVRVGELWQHVIEQTVPDTGEGWNEVYALYRSQGCLARRITTALGEAPGRDRLMAVYTRLADCLRDGTLFDPTGI